MTGPQPLPRRSLQARLTLVYAAGIFVAGIVVLAVVTVPLAGVQSAQPARGPGSGAITGTGHGIGPHQILVGSAVAVAILIPVALAAGWLVAGRFLRPLQAITATATAISAGNLHQRLDLGEPADELTELGYILRRPLRPPGSLLRRPATLRRQRLPRAAHSPGRSANPPRGRPR